MATRYWVQTDKWCPVCRDYVPRNKWRYHSTHPCMTHIDNAYRNEMEKLGGNA
jgi:hypothetical protein